MFIPEDPKLKPTCSTCGSTSYETVIAGHGANACRFKRCLACGHQSRREYLHPESRSPAMPATGWRYSAIDAKREF